MCDMARHFSFDNFRKSNKFHLVYIIMIEKKIITDHVPCSERNNNEEYLVQHFDRCQLEIEQSAACSDFSQICFMKKK